MKAELNPRAFTRRSMTFDWKWSIPRTFLIAPTYEPATASPRICAASTLEIDVGASITFSPRRLADTTVSVSR